MKIVLLSGGAGRRLWPMSTESRPKQFLQVLRDQDGNLISMAQRVWGQLVAAGLAGDVWVCCQPEHIAYITEQIRTVNIITEPKKMDTFAAVSLSALYLSDVEGIGDEPIVFMPIDAYTDPDYFNRLKDLPGLLKSSAASVALMGTKPTEPSTKYGYLRMGRSGKVLSFVEKPDHAMARSLVEEGALWNCGVLCLRTRYIRHHLLERGLPVNFRSLRAKYGQIPKLSFDYAVLEFERSLVALTHSGEWKDLGTWEALSAHLGPTMGDVIAENCKGTHVVNELGIPVVALGIEDSIVIATGAGILVSKKQDSQNLKKYIGG